MASRYQCKLKDDILEKAIKELNEPQSNDERLKRIDDLKSNFAEKYPDIELHDNSDEFILRFLRSCEFDEKASLKTLACYHKLQREWREVFELVENKERIRNVFSAGPSMFWGGRAKDGSFILLKRPGLGLGSRDPITSLIACVFLSYEKIIQNEEAQVYGITVIVDLSHLGFRTGMQMASIGKRFLRMLQEVLPIRIRAINIVNEAFVFDALFAIMSKFMNSDIRRKINLHRHNLAGLHESIDVEVLPTILGGTGPELKTNEWTEEIYKNTGEK